ncbi:MAG: hypothetical protein LUD72_09530 [Bacteroidales bacterium]|nr:hypothetical protein [Bacteroidales bacterium]
MYREASAITLSNHIYFVRNDKRLFPSNYADHAMGMLALEVCKKFLTVACKKLLTM